MKKAKKRLTKNRRAMLEFLADCERKSPGRLHKVNNTRAAELEEMGYAERFEDKVYGSYISWRITPAGLAAIGQDAPKAAEGETGAFDVGVGDYVVIKSDVEFSRDSAPDDLQVWQAVGVLKTLTMNGRKRICAHFQHRDARAVDYEIKMLFHADIFEATDISKISSTPEELELWKPPVSDAKDEYTRDEEQARLIARIRELEEGYEAILSELVVARPFNDILDDVRAIARRMLHAEDEPIGE